MNEHMLRAKTAAVAPHISPRPAEGVDCPAMEPAVAARLNECVRTSKEFSLDVKRFLERKTPEEQAAWLKSTTEVGRALFQPWATEILYVLAVTGRARFTELQSLLGISSRTLSDKLQALRKAGFLEREVYDEQPVRIEYFLTKRGRTTAALASPLLAQLNERARRAAGIPD